VKSQTVTVVYAKKLSADNKMYWKKCVDQLKLNSSKAGLSVALKNI